MLELGSKATLSRQENPGDGFGDSRTAKGASLGVAGEEALGGTQEVPPPDSRRDGPHRDGLAQVGMGQGTKLEGI